MFSISISSISISLLSISRFSNIGPILESSVDSKGFGNTKSRKTLSFSSIVIAIVPSSAFIGGVKD